MATGDYNIGTSATRSYGESIVFGSGYGYVYYTDSFALFVLGLMPYLCSIRCPLQPNETEGRSHST
jgi:hypothetical protein